ncbi:DUF6009 family protein [Streptomyces sp. NPDC127077]|uniref:DUF6009 family protein n=1 Tax=Streptomyces sp. NPDC127077 TaxID=3347131 RepID=UPI0036470076
MCPCRAARSRWSSRLVWPHWDSDCRTAGGRMGEELRALEYEDGIVWTEDVERFDYVRQSVELSVSTRRRPVPWTGSGRRVGYSVLRPDSPDGDVPGKFTRRVFWVKDYDRSEQPDGTYKTSAPSESS